MDYLNDSTFRTINTLFILSFKNGKVDPTRESFDIYYMPLAKNFSALIDKKKVFDQQEKANKCKKNCWNVKKQILYNRKLIRLIASSKIL